MRFYVFARYGAAGVHGSSRRRVRKGVNMTVETIDQVGTGVWISVEGVVRRDSVVRDADGVTAVLVMQDEQEARIRGEGDGFAALIEAAADKGKTVMFHGHRLGAAWAAPGVSVRLEGPIVLTGVISQIRRAGPGKPPHVGFWMIREIPVCGGTSMRIGTGVHIMGAEAVALPDLREGDRVTLQAKHGEHGFVATSPLKILSAV